MKKVLLMLLVPFFVNATEVPLHVAQMELVEAWKTTQGASDVTIAVLGTGVNYRLPIFQGKIEKDHTDASYGYDAVADSNDPMDANGYGTRMATLLVTDGGGVAPGSRLIPIRVFDDFGTGSNENMIKGIRYAITRGADILVAAFGVRPNAEICATMKAAEEAGILVIMAAGNQPKELKSDEHPVVCGLRAGVIVAASDEAGNLADFSNYSFRNVHTAAPGTLIPTVDHTGAVLPMDGTSASTALVAGIAALVKSAHPEYTLMQLKEALIRGVTVTEGLRGKVNSNGVISAAKALTVDVNQQR